MKLKIIQAEYVEFIPKELENGILYVSRKYRTASHLCCCGCGTKIVTPLRNTEYVLIEGGQFVSLYPSIGNWNHPCQSHYWISDNHVVWSRQMSKEEIMMGRTYDDALKDYYFNRAACPWWRFGLHKLQQLLCNIFK